MCSYREKKTEPTEMMQLDGYTVDYVEPVPGMFHFFVVKQISVIDNFKLRNKLFSIHKQLSKCPPTPPKKQYVN